MALIKLPPKKAAAVEEALPEPLDTEATTTTSEIAALIEKIGDNHDDFVATKLLIAELTKKVMAPHQERLKALLALLKDYDAHPDTEFTQESENYEVVISKASNERWIKPDTKKALIAKLNKIQPELGWKLIGIPLGEIDKYLAPIEQKAFIDTKQEARSVKEVRSKRIAANDGE